MKPTKSDRVSDIAVLLDVTAAAAEILTSAPRRAAAVTYLRRRGIDAAALPNWALGYAPPGWTRLVDELQTTFSERALLDAGVAMRSTRGSLIDVFRDRVIVPIRDHGGTVAGFVGRDLSGDPNAPKYLNTKQSELFAKGRLLYGLHEGLAANTGSRQMVVVEGPLDVLAIAAHARTAGDSTLLPVAACGTALTAAHAARLPNFQGAQPMPVVVAFDGDAAGRNAALVAGEQVRAAGLDARVAVLEAGLDPADYLARPGSTLAPFTSAKALPLLTLQVQHAIAVQGDHMQWIEGRLGAVRSIANNLATYPVDHAARQIGWIARVLDLDAATVTREVAAAYRTALSASRPARVSTLTREPISI